MDRGRPCGPSTFLCLPFSGAWTFLIRNFPYHKMAIMKAFGQHEFVRQNLWNTHNNSNSIASYSIYFVLSVIDYFWEVRIGIRSLVSVRGWMAFRFVSSIFSLPFPSCSLSHSSFLDVVSLSSLLSLSRFLPILSLLSRSLIITFSSPSSVLSQSGDAKTLEFYVGNIAEKLKIALDQEGSGVVWGINGDEWNPPDLQFVG